ncbi:hypothetical protein EVAR_98350_1 [Eumeta japonica]|uniref:Uncharacterized protein n=1 Tax=Eumeta variegata TaxID=151549 RepID=A0A4C2AD36_EUMVA|nr:hypothetical protein EVAR_98350_1 [Eumeta japonica]
MRAGVDRLKLFVALTSPFVFDRLPRNHEAKARMSYDTAPAQALVETTKLPHSTLFRFSSHYVSLQTIPFSAIAVPFILRSVPFRDFYTQDHFHCGD